MIDENAFGLLLGYHNLEDDEYAHEPAAFVARLRGFHSAALGWLETTPLGEGLQVVDLGHAVYAELAEGDEQTDPVGWLRGWRTQLGAAGFLTIGVLTHGGRWAPESEETADLPGVECLRSLLVYRIAYSSEPLRRALYADTAAQPDPTRPGWGPGLYVDAEAIEALGKKLKNAPTPLHVAGAVFHRLGS